jgi:RNA polymerase sigma-70 factor (ECF subfamily)
MGPRESRELRQIRKGDIESFERLFHRFYKGLSGYARTLVQSGEVAEEVVQDVFYNVWKNRESLRITRSWQSYLYRSVYNNSMMYLRKNRREQVMEEGSIQEPVDRSPDPSQVLEYLEVSDRVSGVLLDLPGRTREIFLLNRQEGLKYREIAERLSISVKTVEANMGKALRALRNNLEQYRQG